jgi:hypothetical protein
MTKNDTYWRSLPLVILGGLVLYIQYKSFHVDLMYNFFIFLVLGIFGYILFFWAIYKDYKSYIKHKSLTCFIPTLTGILLIISIVGLQKFMNNKMSSPSILEAYYKGNLSDIGIDLKVDGSYIISKGGFGGVNYFYGKYKIKDSIITLDNDNIDNVINTNTLVIRKCNKKNQQDSLVGKEIILVQIDKNGNDLETDVNFRVTKDKRNQ